ncbi:claudin 3d isoform X2 [Xyrauchen texanus]|uniref:claudin 3d isoform X2 n=2 Tax=Xyrauchen texanus TaxID=154827 RepID=UPI00224236FA|nr:claudin 3d isoform X2 [Xyrauchen texanus]
MASLGLQMLGIALAFVGCLGDIITCIIPMWRVTAFVGNNIVTAQSTCEGLWMGCVVQSTGQMQCKVYDSMLALSPDLQAARALVVISILLSLFGIILAIVGGKCTTCIENKTAKARVVLSAGMFFIISGLLCLTPVCWSAHTIIRDFYNPLFPDAQRRELGASLYTDMAAFGLEIVGVTLSVLGWILGIVCCAMPMWRVTAFIGTNIVTAQVYWEGIWMSCVVQSTGQMQCKVYDSMLALPMDLQAARALVVVSIILGVLALLVAIMGAKCTNCIDDEATKARVMISSGAAFITAGVMLLIPVSWSAHTIILEFYSQVVPEAQKMEIGASLYLGWAAAALLLIGGSILCCSCPPQEMPKYQPQSRIGYSPHHSVAASTYNKRDYV